MSTMISTSACVVSPWPLACHCNGFATRPVLSFSVSFPDRSVDRLAQGSVCLPYCITGAWAAGTAPCDIKLTGVDSQLANLTGGMDGLYKLWSCEGGRPLYKREEPGAWLYLSIFAFMGPCAWLSSTCISASHLFMGNLGRLKTSLDLTCSMSGAQLCIHSSTANPDSCNDHHCSFSCLPKT